LLGKLATAGGDLGVRGDESFREEVEKVLCNGKKRLSQQPRKGKGLIA
jgi:hypothetical protein